MKFNYLDYCTGKYVVFTKCGFKVLSIDNYCSPRDHYLECRITNEKGEINLYSYNYDGEFLGQMWSKNMTSWDVSRSDMKLVMYECKKEWFNVRVGVSGVLESSVGYDTESDALSHKLLSDIDTICVITKINNNGKNEKIEEI